MFINRFFKFDAIIRKHYSEVIQAKKLLKLVLMKEKRIIVAKRNMWNENDNAKNFLSGSIKFGNFKKISKIKKDCVMFAVDEENWIDHSINLMWIPGHDIVQCDDIAHKLAKKEWKYYLSNWRIYKEWVNQKLS